MPRAERNAAHPTRQVRSLRTQERILAAAEALLAERAIDTFTIEDISDRAHVSIGAFYKRFRGKSSLLPLLLERVQAQQLRRLREFLALPEWQSAGLTVRIRAMVGAFVGAQIERRNLFRGLVVGHWSEPHAASDASQAQPIMLDLMVWLGEGRGEILHPDPDLALRFGLFTVLHTLQSMLLFQPQTATLPIERLVEEMTGLFVRYLGLEPVAAAT